MCTLEIRVGQQAIEMMGDERGSMNLNVVLKQGEVLESIEIHATHLTVLESFVEFLNRQLNRVRCTVCARKTSTHDTAYRLSFRFMDEDRHVIHIVLHETANASSYGLWMRHIADHVFVVTSN